MIQESNLKASDKLVGALKKSKQSSLTSLTGTGKDDLGILVHLVSLNKVMANMLLLIIQEGKALKHMM